MKLFANFLLSLLLVASPAWAAVDFDGLDDGINFGSAASLDDAIYSVYVDFEQDAEGDTTGPRVLAKNPIFWTANTTFHAINFLHACTTGELTRRSADNSIALDTRYRVVVKGDRGATAANYEIYINGSQPSYAATVNCTTGSPNTDAASVLCI